MERLYAVQGKADNLKEIEGFLIPETECHTVATFRTQDKAREWLKKRATLTNDRGKAHFYDDDYLVIIEPYNSVLHYYIQEIQGFNF